MSIAGYLSSRYNRELRMPKPGESTSNRGKDTLSIRYEGPVLTGEKSVEQQRRDDVIRAAFHRPDLYDKIESYSKVVDRDPPIREHAPAIPGRSVLPLESKPGKSGPGIIWRVRK